MHQGGVQGHQGGVKGTKEVYSGTKGVYKDTKEVYSGTKEVYTRRKGHSQNAKQMYPEEQLVRALAHGPEGDEDDEGERGEAGDAVAQPCRGEVVVDAGVDLCAHVYEPGIMEGAK